MRHTQTLDVIQQPKKYMEKYARAFLDRQENCGGMTSAPPETTLGGAPVLKVEIDWKEDTSQKFF